MSVKSNDGPRRKGPAQSKKAVAAGAKGSAVVPDNTFIQLAEHAKDAILIIDSEGSYVFANRRSSEILGYGIAELLGMGYRDIILPDDLESAREIFARRLAGDSVGNVYEIRVVDKEGNVFVVEVSGTKITWEGADAVMIIARDMRERTMKDRQLRENGELLRATLESSCDGMLVVNDAWQVLARNERFNRMWDVPAALSVTENAAAVLEYVAGQLLNPDDFLSKLAILHGTDRDDHDLLFSGDGRAFEYYSSPFVMAGTVGGRVWRFYDVTTRERIKTERNRAEEKYHDIVENSINGVFQTTPDGRIIMANPACARIMGYDSADELVRNVSSLASDVYLRPGDRQELMKCLSAEGVVKDFMARLKMKDGTIKWVSINCRALCDHAGVHILNEGSFQDVTDRVMVEEALRYSEERYRLIFENIGNSTMIVEEDTTISAVNTEFEKLSGYSKDEVEGKKRFVDFVDTDEAERLRNLHERRLGGDGDVPTRYETYFYTKDGERRDILATVILLPGTRRCIDSVIDITARKQAERKLCQSEETTRILLNATDASALLIDGHGTIMAANRTAAEAVGRVENDLVGRNFGDYVNPRLARMRKDNLNRTLALKHPVRYTEKIDGRLMDVTVYPVLDARGEISLCAVYSHDVTEQRAAEDALRESEEKYRSHFENVHDVIYSIDSDMLITSVSPSVERALGYSPDELAGKYFHNLLFLLQPEYRDKGYRNVLRLLAGEQLESGVYGFTRKDGRKVFCEITGSPYFRDGKVVGSVSVVRDITDRKKTEDALRESEFRYRQIVEYAPAGIYEVDYVTEQFTSVNDVMCEYSGYTREELLRIHFMELFTEESKGILKVRFDKLRKGESVSDTAEYCIRSKEGRIIWILMNARYNYENGVLKGAAGVAYDITTRKNAEEKIKKSEEQLRTVLESMPVMLTATDERGRIAVWNSACERVTGYSLDEMRRNPDFLEVLYPDPEYRAALLSELESSSGVFYSRETTLTCKDGSLKTVSWSNISKDYPIPGWDMWAVGLDITEIKKAEKVLVNANAELGRQVEERTKELNLKAGKLEETNAALRTLLKTAEDFKEDVERRILANITQIIMPYLERLKKSQLSTDQMTYCNILETHIRNITSPFAKRLSPPYLNFTPQEIKISTLIREHKTTKDIAKLLNISESAVIFHRHNIRKKLGVVSKKVNLEAYLQSFS